MPSQGSHKIEVTLPTAGGGRNPSPEPQHPPPTLEEKGGGGIDVIAAHFPNTSRLLEERSPSHARLREASSSAAVAAAGDAALASISSIGPASGHGHGLRQRSGSNANNNNNINTTAAKSAAKCSSSNSNLHGVGGAAQRSKATSYAADADADDDDDDGVMDEEGMADEDETIGTLAAAAAASSTPQRRHRGGTAAGDDNEDDDVDEHDYAPDEAAQRFTKLYRRRAELSRTAQERLDRAAARRAELQRERLQQLRVAERRRQAKTAQTRALRRQATERFVKEAPKALETLRSAGLVCDASNGYMPIGPDAVEIILMSDPRTCGEEACRIDPNKLRMPVCPATGQPHRRMLIVAAEAFLKLIGDTRVNLIPSRAEVAAAVAARPPAAKRSVAAGAKSSQTSAPSSNAASGAPSGAAPSAGAAATAKAKRGITVNPQLLVLAYYNAVLPDGEVDPLLRDCAVHLCHVTEQIRAALAKINKRIASSSDDVPSSSPADISEDAAAAAAAPPAPLTDSEEHALKPLLIAFSREWQRYARLSNQHILSNISEGDRSEAARELVKSTEEALRHTYAQLATAVAEAAGAEGNTTATNGPQQQQQQLTTAQQQYRRQQAALEVEALSSFVAMLRARLSRVGGGQSALDAFDEAMRRREADAAARSQHEGGDLLHSGREEEAGSAAAASAAAAGAPMQQGRSSAAAGSRRGGYFSSSALTDGNPSDGYATTPSAPRRGPHPPAVHHPSAESVTTAAASTSEATAPLLGSISRQGSSFVAAAAPLHYDPAAVPSGGKSTSTTAVPSPSPSSPTGGGATSATAEAVGGNGGAAAEGGGDGGLTPSPIIMSPLGVDVPPNTPADAASPPTAATTAASPSITTATAAALSSAVRPKRNTTTNNSNAYGSEAYLGTSGSDTDLGGAFPRRAGAGASSSVAAKQSSAPSVVFGPALPPLWTVGADGKSHPPAPEVLQRERRERLEYRAKAAYTAKLRRDAMATRAEAEERRERERIAASFDQLMWAQFKAELDESRPPNLHRVPFLLNAVSEAFIEALPRRIRAKVGQEIRDVLDWDVLRSRLSHRSASSASLGGAESGSSAVPSPASPSSPTTDASSAAAAAFQQQQQQNLPKRFEAITSLVVYVINRISQLGAPAREEALHNRAKDLVARLDGLLHGKAVTSASASDTIGSLVVEMFQFMLESVRTLREDIAAYSLQLVGRDLALGASAYEAEFVSECLPPVAEWGATRAFLAKGLADAETLPMVPQATPPSAQPNSPASPSSSSAAASAATPLQQQTLRPIASALPPSVLYTTAEARRCFAAVAAGAVDLLRSSGRDAQTRWALYPSESFYFARPLIFEAANSVQMAALRLMVSGAASMVLAPHRVNPLEVQKFLTSLDAKVVVWLGGGEAEAAKRKKQKNGEEDGGGGDDANTGDADDNDADDGEEKPARTIEDIKAGVNEAVSVFLGSRPLIGVGPAARRSPAPITPTEADVAVLDGVVAKMTDTTSPQYTLFETRVLRAVGSVALGHVALASSGLTTASSSAAVAGGGAGTPSSLAPAVGAAAVAAAVAAGDAALRGCGALVGPSVREVGELIGAILLQNWEVHRGHYLELMPLAPEVVEGNGATTAPSS